MEGLADCNEKLQLMIYYKSGTVNNLIVRNNQSPKLTDLKQTNLIDEYKYTTENCELRNFSYIGYTTTALSRRFMMHLASGACKNSHWTFIKK